MKSTKLVPLVRVPEVLLKKRKKNLEEESNRVQKLSQVRKEKKEQRKAIFQRAEKYFREYRTEQRNKEFLTKQAETNGNFYVAPEAKLAFVVRIKG
jgi:large subunit ribosomal protein L7e